VKTIEVNSYSIDSVNEVVICDGVPLGCVETAKKAQAVSKKNFSFFTWVYFYAVDLLAYLFSSFKKRQFTEISTLVDPIIAEQKTFIQQRKKISDFVKKHFEVISQNVKHLDEAEVICFGETHGTYHHMFHNAQVIDALAEPESDLILVEHDDKLSFRSDQAKYVKTPLPVKGWDKLDEKIIKELSKKLSLDPISLISQIFFGRISTKKLEDMKWATQKIIDDLPDRNRHMCKTIEENRAKKRRIYTIAGSGHLSMPDKKKVDYLNTDSKPQEVAYKETLEYLKTKKHAILIPKTKRPFYTANR
jgi:hypothetical protein